MNPVAVPPVAALMTKDFLRFLRGGGGAVQPLANDQCTGEHGSILSVVLLMPSGRLFNHQLRYVLAKSKNAHFAFAISNPLCTRAAIIGRTDGIRGSAHSKDFYFKKGLCATCTN